MPREDASPAPFASGVLGLDAMTFGPAENLLLTSSTCSAGFLQHCTARRASSRNARAKAGAGSAVLPQHPPRPGTSDTHSSFAHKLIIANRSSEHRNYENTIKIVCSHPTTSKRWRQSSAVGAGTEKSPRSHSPSARSLVCSVQNPSQYDKSF